MGLFGFAGKVIGGVARVGGKAIVGTANVAGKAVVGTANIAGKAVVGTAKVGGKVVAGAATVAGKIVEDKIDDTFDTLDKVVDGDIGGLAKKQIKNKLQSEAFSAVGSIIKK